MLGKLGRGIAAVCGLATVALGAVLPAPSGAAPATVSCQEQMLPVSGPPGVPGELHIAGELCLPAGRPPATVVITVPGATYNHTYWNFPMKGYSYARAMAERGYAVFAMDRLNTGQSSSLPPAALTVDVDAATIHQVITALRAGKVGGVPFKRVVIGGHSLGSIITIQESTTYRDVDGVMLTGFSHALNPAFIVALFSGQVLVPSNGSGDSPYVRNNPEGEMSTPPGGREQFFYAAANSDPAVIAKDEATKDIITAGELMTFPEPMIGLQTNTITVPVLFAIGSREFLFFCGMTACPDKAAVLEFEGPRFGAAAPFEPFVLPGGSHDLNTSRNAPVFFDAAADWLDRHFGGATG